jgi:prolyl-tRNA synthetase
VGVDQARDLPDVRLADLHAARAGDPCPRCNDGTFESHRGIEVGNIFYLGTKYSVPMKATYLDASGQEHPMVMGCYGIGITRTAAAAIEQNHDANGIIWPLAIAPADVHIVPVSWSDEALRTTAEALAQQLEQAGIEVLLDDRDERPGVKFKDADLIGVPLRVTIGPKSLARGCVELKHRRDTRASELPVGDVVQHIQMRMRTELEQ